jgi:hypothetical protein
MDQETFEAAVRRYWVVREGQAQRQRETGKLDAGLRGAVTGGAHMDAMAELMESIFIDASYKKRYEILCRRLVLERLYDAVCFITASADPTSPIHEPAPDLNFMAFAKAIRARANGLLSA